MKFFVFLRAMNHLVNCLFKFDGGVESLIPFMLERTCPRTLIVKLSL
jgi:hypothetical protein